MTPSWDHLGTDYADLELNFTSPNFEEPPGLPPGVGAALGLDVLAFLLGVPGNVAVIWVSGVTLRRTVNGVWFLNLAVADLFSCLALPFLALPLAQDHHWPLGGFSCKLLPSLTILTMFTSVFLLTAISADRCAVATRWWHRTPVVARGACVAAWVLAFLLSLPSFLLRTLRRDPFSEKTTCGLDYAALGRGAELGLAALRLFAGFVIPVVAMVGFYGWLLARGHPATRPVTTVVVLVGCFVGCWLPYHAVMVALALYAPGAAPYKQASGAQPLAIALAHLNGALNPLLYVLLGRGRAPSLGGRLAWVLRGGDPPGDPSPCTTEDVV
ncbi:C5a anaphylatoxin chemotactic receptor 1-like [Anas acuta]|uniref:C5a anaphylatoxin chemotactic receptor 1-like n=1 Tax=Anas acuta TaxID=28680 RepID=UPI0035C941AB